MLDHYLKLLKSDLGRPYNGPAGYSYFNKTIAKWDDIEDVTQLEFRYFYQSLMVDLYKRGEIDLRSDQYLIDYMSDVESFLKNSDALMESDYALYLDLKDHSQRLYGEILRKSPSQIKNLINLIHLMFNDVVKNSTNIIEIDTYLFYLQNKELIDGYKKRKISKKVDRLLVKDLYKSGKTQKEISILLSVTKSTISGIIKEINAMPR